MTSLRSLARRGLKSRWREALQILKFSAEEFVNDDLVIVSASIAFYTLLAIFPFLLLLLALAGIFIHHYALDGQLAIVLNRYLPMKPDFIMRNLVGITKGNGQVGIVSFLLLLWSSSGVFIPLERALNTAWEVKFERVWWKSRLLALELALLGGLSSLIVLGLVGLHHYFGQWLLATSPGHIHPFVEGVYRGGVTASAFGITLLMFLVLFRYLPNRKLRFREILPSALLTAILWELSRVLFTMLLRHINYSHIYGGIAAMVTLMTWAYVSAAVMMLGARISNNLYNVFYSQENY